MKIPVSETDLTNLELNFAKDAIKSNWISSSGKYVDLVQQSLKAFTGQEFNSLTCNGTVAIHLALEALNIGLGDEVIVPSFTFVATVNAVLYTGATPVFADINLSNLCLNLDDVKNKINERTKAIIFVHIYGMPNDLTEFGQYCKNLGIHLIEDNAEAIGAKISNKINGSYGIVSTYSFYGNKIISCGEGGNIATSNKKLHSRINQLKNQGTHKNVKYYFPVKGFNYRLNNVSAAILYGQILRFNKMLGNRFKVFRRYDDFFNQYENILRLKSPTNGTLSPWIYPILLKSKKDRDFVVSKLRMFEIETRPFFIPIHTMKPFKKYNLKNNKLIITNKINGKGLLLPTSSKLDAEKLTFIIEKLALIFSELNYD